MVRVLGYGCNSSAGPSSSSFWTGLRQGKDHSSPVCEHLDLVGTAIDPTLQACFWKPEPRPGGGTRGLLVRQLSRAWNEALEGLSPSEKKTFPRDERLGVILVTTKGCIEDFIWDASDAAIASEMGRDPFGSILSDFLVFNGLKTSNTICVSNACASALSALVLARSWIRQKRVSHVVVLAADRVGRFVLQGFHCLRALSTTRARSASGDRDGLRLGEAAAAILLSHSESPGRELFLAGLGLETEGYAVTRPSVSGTSLRKACQAALSSAKVTIPDLIIAHGTATPINDLAEDQVFISLFPDGNVPVTGTKGSIGHTLAASGAMDFIAACRALEEQMAFPITNTRKVDPAFGSRYLISQDGEDHVFPLKTVMVSSLGFGGVHSAACLRWES